MTSSQASRMWSVMGRFSSRAILSCSIKTVRWTSRGEKADGLTAAAADDGFGTAVAAGMFGDVFDDTSARNDAAGDFAVGAPNRVVNGHGAAGAFQEFLGQVNATPVFQLGFDENRVNGIQPRRPGAPAPVTCTAID